MDRQKSNRLAVGLFWQGWATECVGPKYVWASYSVLSSNIWQAQAQPKCTQVLL
jgi:hypothetical protein